MKKLCKRLICAFAVCAMLLSLLPLGAMALTTGDGSESNPYVVSDYAKLRELMGNAPNDGTVVYIKLGADIESVDIQNDYTLTLTRKYQEVVLDLAGHSITRVSNATVDASVIRALNGTLNIKDSVGTGGVYANGKIESAIAMTSTGLVGNDDGIINIYGGTYQSYSYNNYAVYNESSELYIYGGNFKATGHGDGIFAAAGVTYIYGGNFYADGTDSKSIYLGADQKIMLYNLTAYGRIDSNNSQNDIWQYTENETDIYVDGVKLTDKSSIDEIEGNVIEFKTEMLDKIEVFVFEPKVGDTIKYTASVPMGVNYEIYYENDEPVIAWFVDDDFANDVFERETSYLVRVLVKVKCLVMPNCYAEINGNKANLRYSSEKDDGSVLYWVEYTFPKTEEYLIKSADIKINNPKSGETATAGIIGVAENCVISIDWHPTTNSDDYGKLNNKPFGTGVCYATIYLSAGSPYEFDSNAQITINGTVYEFQWPAEALKTYISISNVPFLIDDSSNNSGNSGNDSDNSQPKLKKGDINGKDGIDSMDYVLLKRAYFGTYTLKDIRVGDINNNEIIDSMDYVYLRRAYFGTYVIK